MKVVVPGGTGYVGGRVVPLLAAAGHDVVVLTRGQAREDGGVRYVSWDGRTLGAWASEVDGADAVLHLAGRRVDARPTRRGIDELVRSRVESVRVVGEAVAAAERPPRAWVQLATLAIHGDTGEAVVTDDSVPDGLGPRQMTTVALAWESAVRTAAAPCERVVVLRAGIAVGGLGDPATARLLQLVRLGLGGAVAGGRQWVSWIAEEDLVRIVLRALDEDRGMRGTYNATSPAPVRNAELMAAYRAAVGRRVGLPAPRPLTVVGAWLLGSDPALALTGRRAVPARLEAEGFRFRRTSLSDTVAAAVASAGVG